VKLDMNGSEVTMTDLVVLVEYHKTRMRKNHI
jgi:hypothetical protein